MRCRNGREAGNREWRKGPQMSAGCREPRRVGESGGRWLQPSPQRRGAWVGTAVTGLGIPEGPGAD